MNPPMARKKGAGRGKRAAVEEAKIDLGELSSDTEADCEVSPSHSVK